MSALRDQLLEHLRTFAEFGVAGVSRDPAWRAREDAGTRQERDGPDGDAEDPRAAGDVAADGLPDGGPAVAAAGAPGRPARAVMAPADALEALRLEIGPDCSRCKLSRLGRTQVVFGVGSPTADLMFVGEGPGFEEDQQGIPFVGRAGQLLTKMIEAIELRREDVYIANVVKCRPPENRNPEPDEIAACGPFLLRQIEIVNPRVIVTLGKFAAQTLLHSNAPVSKLRGHDYPFHGAVLVPTFHPAFLLRSPAYKREAWEDLKRVRALLSAASGRTP